MNDEQKKKIDQEGTFNARLQFHPEHSRDAYTACVISFRAGAKLIIDHPGDFGLNAQSEQTFSREEVIAMLVEYRDSYQGEHGVKVAVRWLDNKLKH